MDENDMNSSDAVKQSQKPSHDASVHHGQNWQGHDYSERPEHDYSERPEHGNHGHKEHRYEHTTNKHGHGGNYEHRVT